MYTIKNMNYFCLHEIKIGKYNKKYWNIENKNDIFKDVFDKKELKRMVFRYILNELNIKCLYEKNMDNDIKFVRISAKEYTEGRLSNSLNYKTYIQKLRIAPSIYDLINNADIVYDTIDHKNHKIAKEGFKNYKGRVRIDNVIFKYIVRVGKKNNVNIFYDINLQIEQIIKRDAKVPVTKK